MGILCATVGATYTAPTPTFAVAAAGGATSVNEGSTLNFNVTGTNIPDGTYYWSSSNTTDFVTTGGSFGITSNSGTFSVTPTADLTTEGAETFTVSVRLVSTSGTIVATSATITINDTSLTPAPTYAVAAAGGITSVNEGTAITFNVTTTNVPNGTTLYFRTNRDADFNVPIAGSFTINSNAGSFSVTPTADATTEGAETFQAQVRTVDINGTIVATSANITINDTSQTPATTYAVTPAASSVNEGSSLTFNVSGTNITNGTYYWTVANNTTANADFSAVSGSFTITSNVGSFSITATADVTTEGAQTFSVQIRSVSITGTILATSSQVTINDTSTTPTITTRADSFASSLRLAIPFSTNTQRDDVAFRVSGSPNTVMLTPIEAGGGTIVTSTFKFYNSSYQPAASGIGYTLPVGINTSNAFFIEFWARTTSTDINNWVFGNLINTREWTIGINVGGSTPSNLTPNNGNGRIGGISSGAWNHYAFSNANWWLNGVRRGTCNWGGTGYTANTIYVGRQPGYTIFNGQIQDFRIYIGTNKGVTTGNFTVPLSILT
jgi:predicted subunit of tRNA(5-methylaminomethyl-2-thiouridylate) methyltransferase